MAAIAASAVASSAFASGTFAYAATYAVTYAATSLAVSKVSSALFGKTSGGKGGLDGGISQQSNSRTQVVRSAVQAMNFVYGETLVSGPLAFADTSGASKQNLHLVVPMAAHEVEAFGSVFLNDTEITPNQIDGAGNVVSGKYSGLVRINEHLGTKTQTADANLVSEVTNWTPAHRLREIAYPAVRLTHDDGAFKTGIPNIKAALRGKKLYDPRTGLTIYGTNPALVVRDYLTSPLGLGVLDAEINDPLFIAAANVCDEFVGVTAVIDTFTVDSITDTLTRLDANKYFPTGDRVRLATTGTLPGGLAAATDYYVVRVGPDTVQLATTYANALARTIIDILDVGTGTHTLTKTAQVRYDAHGTIELDKRPADALEGVLSACAGVLVYSQGQYGLKVSTANTSIAQINAAWLRGAVKVRPKAARRILFNAVRGTFVDAARHHQATDFPPVENVNYEVQDSGITDMFTVDVASDVLTLGLAGGWFKGAEKVVLTTTGTLPGGLSGSTTYFIIKVSSTTLKLAGNLDDALAGTSIDIFDVGTGAHTIKLASQFVRDIELPFTTDAIRAQRLSKIHLEKSRQGITVDLPCNMKALSLSVWDVVDLTLAQYGWAAKQFRVLEFRLSPDGGIDLVLQEESSAAYDWAGGDATAYDPAPDTNLTPALTVVSPTNFVLSSGTADLFTAADGTVHSRIRATWTAPLDAYAKNIEIQWKVTAGTAWSSRLISVDVTENLISPVEDGIDYDVRIRAVNGLDVKSSWTTTNHTVIGKTAPPADVSSFAIDGTVLSWVGPESEVDLAGYFIRYHYGVNYDWATAAALHTGVLQASPYDMGVIPPGQITVLIKAVDTSENVSLNAAKIVTDLGDALVANVVESYVQAPTWTGALTNGAIVSGAIEANEVSVPFWSGDGNVFWTGDSNAFWTPMTYQDMTYEFSFTPSLAAAGSNLTLDFTAVGDGLNIEYRKNDTAFWTGDSNAFWTDDTAAFWTVKSYQPWPGSVTATNEQYDVRVTTGAGSTQGVWSVLTAQIDVPDLQEQFSALALLSAGSRLSLTKTFTVITVVNVTLQDDGGSAHTVIVKDKNISLGPLIQALDTAGTGTAGTIDAIIQGY